MAESDGRIERVVIRGARRRRVARVPHGGWKVAYADFVTAMMAFFLLMWLVSSTDQGQREGISDYFKRSPAPSTGLSPNRPDVASGDPPAPVSLRTAEDLSARPPAAPLPAPPAPSPVDRRAQAMGARVPEPASGHGAQANQLEFLDTLRVNRDDYDRLQRLAALGQQVELGAVATQARMQAPPEAGAKADARSNAQAATAAATVPAETEALAADLEKFKASQPILHRFAGNVAINALSEGVRIQLIDQPGFEMFPIGSARLTPQAEDLIAKVAEVLRQLPYSIVITGNTDGRPYRRSADYANWELSADRANAARRALIADGVQSEKILRVVGKGDTELLIPDDPLDQRNRRITFLVVR